MSFLTDKIDFEGLTFDDVLLIPSYSDILPRDVDITTHFTRNIRLNTPIVSASMDTVTEAAMAMAIAREGGIGVIHKNMTIEDQAKQVVSVKRAENGMIMDPVTIFPFQTVGDARKLMHEFKIGGIPVITENKVLVGIVTNRDLRFEKDDDRVISEVMTQENLVTTDASTGLGKAEEILQKNKIEKLPVVDKDYRLVGLLTYKDLTITKDRPNACKDEQGRLRVAAGVGVTLDTLDRISALVAANVDAIVIDTAHGHSMGVIEMLKKAKSQFPNIEFVVGNIATGDAARA
ncbi:MAG: IMP dehydrogenase, partial [Bacteroidales bacterium]|nr:IMP dehydrogenase [Bacteroidales bacterium]